MADGGIGKPRLDFAFGGGIGDGAREGASLGVGHQLHGADFAGAVAALAMLLEYGEDVAIERGRSNRGLRWLGRRLRRGLILLLLRGAGGREQQKQDRWQRDSQETMDAGWAVGVFVLGHSDARIVHRVRRRVRWRDLADTRAKCSLFFQSSDVHREWCERQLRDGGIILQR